MSPTPRKAILSSGVTLAATALISFQSDILVTPAPARPNIIVIMSDDMGFSDIGCYGGEIRTPALDKLARNGLRFTQFYNGARCCPTRASLLTGLYPHQAGVGLMVGNPRGNLPGYQGEFSKSCLTIAEVLRPAGYATYAVGKWHVSPSTPDAKANWPLQRGFDRFYGTLAGAGSYYDPATLCRGNTFITPENDPEYKSARFYYTDAIADNAVRYLRDHTGDPASAAKPFFMYVAFTAAHWPMHAPPEDIARYKGRYDAGFEAIRAGRYRRVREFGLVPPSTRLGPPAVSWADTADKEWEARCMEVYAAMVDRMDQGIARIVAELEAAGQLENTLILFLHDNGGCAETMGLGRGTPRAFPENINPLGPDELQTKVLPPMQTRDGRPVRTQHGIMPGAEDTYIAYGKGWANVSNTPFREYKHWVHEGGISTPLIAHWPKGIRRNLGGSLVHSVGHIIDIAATCRDVANAAYPNKRDGTPITPLEGISLRPAFSGETLDRPSPLCWEHEGNRAIRLGKWKLVAKGRKGAWELYDMEADRAELNDLASQHPDIVQKLASDWDAWALRAKVKPWPWDNPEAGRIPKGRSTIHGHFRTNPTSLSDGGRCGIRGRPESLASIPDYIKGVSCDAFFSGASI
ncbi:arylsulfatase [Ereboglobus luteus]|uniref:Arylsulfatase n=1 Tax=Ereboglobus luteus TaxID=1796921 RepID=A0A2U8E2Y7_9BACT|nr:arylsulfatase [Ereboglobus luteus]AWI09237.1 arylsulfatase [Ereboglobus luteus]